MLYIYLNIVNHKDPSWMQCALISHHNITSRHELFLPSCLKIIKSLLTTKTFKQYPFSVNLGEIWNFFVGFQNLMKKFKKCKNSSWQIMSLYNNCISNYTKCQISVLNQTSTHSDISQNKPVRLFQIWADWQCLHLEDTAIGQCHDMLQQEMFHWIC